MHLSQRRKTLLALSLLIFLSSFFLLSQYQYQIRNTLSYATRPLWDHPDGPHHIVPHFYADGMHMDEYACQLHSWDPRPKDTDVRVLDAVLMSSELDLLEIRLHELDQIVDRFFIVESNATFTGLPKETFFADNRERFAAFEHKIEYHFLPGFGLHDDQSAWNVEAHTRDFMTSHLRAYADSLPPSTQTLVIMSDIDELPAWHTLALLKACDFGDRIHLLLRNYLYSFEWHLGLTSWRASVHRFDKENHYRHSLSSDTALADAGWHCSYCFRTLPEYIMKMRGFSHSDRIGGNERLLDERRIQEVICNGEDIFGMLPEAYSYGDLLSQMYLRPVYATKFKFDTVKEVMGKGILYTIDLLHSDILNPREDRSIYHFSTRIRPSDDWEPLIWFEPRSWKRVASQIGRVTTSHLITAASREGVMRTGFCPFVSGFCGLYPTHIRVATSA